MFNIRFKLLALQNSIGIQNHHRVVHTSYFKKYFFSLTLQIQHNPGWLVEIALFLNDSKVVDKEWWIN